MFQEHWRSPKNWKRNLYNRPYTPRRNLRLLSHQSSSKVVLVRFFENVFSRGAGKRAPTNWKISSQKQLRRVYNGFTHLHILDSCTFNAGLAFLVRPRILFQAMSTYPSPICGGLISICAGVREINAFFVGPHFSLCEELEIRRA